MATTTTTSWTSMLAGVISESKRVVSAHTRHFLALSVLFLLPLSLLILFLPFSPSSSSSSLHPQSLLRSPSPSFSLLPLSLISLSLLLLSLCAFSSISISTLNSFFSRPVKLLPSLSSIPSSLLRLLFTLPFPLLLYSPLLFFSIPFFFFFYFLSSFLSLAFPVAVLENTWGYQPFRRSKHLSQGMGWAMFFLHLFFIAGIGVILWGFSWREMRGFGDWKEAVPVVGWMVFGTAVMMVLMLYWMVSGVVLYLYCKAIHGELADEIVAEFAWEYVCLPDDENKVPHMVSVIRQG